MLWQQLQAFKWKNASQLNIIDFMSGEKPTEHCVQAAGDTSWRQTDECSQSQYFVQIMKLQQNKKLVEKTLWWNQFHSLKILILLCLGDNEVTLKVFWQNSDFLPDGDFFSDFNSVRTSLCNCNLGIWNASVTMTQVLLWSERGKLILLVTVLEHFYKG